LSVTYTLDLWHRIRNTVAADAYQAQASAADIQTALLSVQTQLAQDYFELRAVDAQRLILQDTLQNYQDALRLTTILYKTGIDSEQDVTQAQVQFDTASAELTDLGVARAQYEHAIAVLIGKPASSFDIPYGEFVPNPPQIPVAVPSELLERRPDIAALERVIASDNALIGVARAAYYPNLTLSASGGLQTTDITQWFTWPSRFWSLGPSLAQTFFDGGARKAAVSETEANYDAAVANYRETVLTSFEAVEDALAASRILSDEVVQQQRAINSSQHYLDLANTRYKTGVDSYLNVITAQNTLLTNRETAVSVELRQMTSSVQLILALGGGWDASQLPEMKDILHLAPRNNQAPGGAPSPAAPGYNPAPLPKAAPGS
jgi:NodT family efflux transporter outer membrane factor (OMF) lipoprotein